MILLTYRRRSAKKPKMFSGDETLFFACVWTNRYHGLQELVEVESYFEGRYCTDL